MQRTFHLESAEGLHAPVQEYVRQVLLEKIIHESEQAALREQAASLLAASHPVAARPGSLMGAPQPASGMKAFHQQHLQNQLLRVWHVLCDILGEDSLQHGQHTHLEPILCLCGYCYRTLHMLSW